MQQMRRPLHSITALLVGVALIATVFSMFAAPRPAFACPSTPGEATCSGTGFKYGHSWYVTNPGELTNLAQYDASFANSTCNSQTNTTYLNVLNFGRPGLVPGTNNYGVLTHSLSITWLTESQVESYAEQYAQTWYNDTTSCPRLRLVIGTSNDYECYNGAFVSGCSVYQAGVWWDIVAHDVQSYLNNNNYAWQESAQTGDDIEGGWDRYTDGTGGADPCTADACTVDFLNGVETQEASYSSHLFLYDYGDANAGSSTDQGNSPWSVDQIYSAAWGIGWDLPLPETYYYAQTDRWLAVYNYSNGIQFQGDMTECSEGDPLPQTPYYCSVTRDGNCQLSPSQGFNRLEADFPDAGNQASIQYATNIQWPDDTRSGYACASGG